MTKSHTLVSGVLAFSGTTGDFFTPSLALGFGEAMFSFFSESRSAICGGVLFGEESTFAFFKGDSLPADMSLVRFMTGLVSVVGARGEESDLAGVACFTSETRGGTQGTTGTGYIVSK